MITRITSLRMIARSAPSPFLRRAPCLWRSATRRWGLTARHGQARRITVPQMHPYDARSYWSCIVPRQYPTGGALVFSAYCMGHRLNAPSSGSHAVRGWGIVATARLLCGWAGIRTLGLGRVADLSFTDASPSAISPAFPNKPTCWARVWPSLPTALGGSGSGTA